jgi:hypothetical protein
MSLVLGQKSSGYACPRILAAGACGTSPRIYRKIHVSWPTFPLMYSSFLLVYLASLQYSSRVEHFNSTVLIGLTAKLG